MDNRGEQLLDVLVVEEWQTVKVPTVNLALLLEPRLRHPHLVVEPKTLSQLCSWNAKLSEVRGVAVDGVVSGKLEIGVVASSQIANPARRLVAACEGSGGRWHKP